MFTWLGNKLDSLLSTYVLGVVSQLAAVLTPLALSAMTLWVMLFGWAVVRGEVAEPLSAFLWNTFKIGLTLALGLQSGLYLSQVADTANALALSVATNFVPTGIEPSTITSPYVLLDHFNDLASAQVADIMKEASVLRLDLVLAAVVFSFGSVGFLCMALFVVTLSKLILTFVIAIGPLFVLCLAWRPVQRFFDSWLSMLLNAVILSWFSFFALGLSTYTGLEIFKAIQDGGGFLGAHFNVLGEATRYCILMILMAVVCFQAPALASALTGGAVIQQGVQMVQNTLMVSGLRSRSSTPAGPHAGGSIRPGLGLPYVLGSGTGAGLRMARQGMTATKTAAYRMATLRGHN